jgi:hypothetical protein
VYLVVSCNLTHDQARDESQVSFVINVVVGVVRNLTHDQDQSWMPSELVVVVVVVNVVVISDVVGLIKTRILCWIRGEFCNQCLSPS